MPFCLFGFAGLLLSYRRNSKAWMMHSSGIASRKEREIRTVNNWSWKLLDQVQSHTAVVINFIFHHKRLCQEAAKGVLNSKIAKHWMNLCQWPQSLWQPGFLHSKRCQLYSIMQSALIRLYSKFSFQFSQSIPFIAMWTHPKTIKKNTSRFFFGVVLIPWFFFSPSRNCQHKWILAVFLFHKWFHT